MNIRNELKSFFEQLKLIKGDPINYYHCKCGNLKGLLNENIVCPKCNTIVKFDEKDKIEFFAIKLLDSVDTCRNKKILDRDKIIVVGAYDYYSSLIGTRVYFSKFIPIFERIERKNIIKLIDDVNALVYLNDFIDSNLNLVKRGIINTEDKKKYKHEIFNNELKGFSQEYKNYINIVFFNKSII